MTMPTRAPNPETLEKPRRRHHPAKFKIEILDLADQAGPGETAELLRKHGLYSSHLTSWRRARELGTLGALAKKRGPKADPRQAELDKLSRENAKPGPGTSLCCEARTAGFTTASTSSLISSAATRSAETRWRAGGVRSRVPRCPGRWCS